MTDEPNPDLDELLSADLDGETTADDRARIGDDDDVRMRRDALRAAADLAGRAPTPLPPAAVDALIGSTLDRTREPARAPSSGTVRTPTQSPTEDEPFLPPPRPRRVRPPRAWRGPRPALVAAVVLVLLVAGLTLVFTDRPSSRSDDRSAASKADPGADERTSGAGSTGGAGATAGQPVVDDLGDFVDPAALRTAFRERVPGPSAAPVRPVVAFTSAQVDRCHRAIEARNPGLLPAARRRTAAATVAGSPVLVVEYSAASVRTGDPTTRVVAVGIFACDDRVNFER